MIEESFVNLKNNFLIFVLNNHLLQLTMTIRP